MDRLPQEVVDRILACLPDDGIRYSALKARGRRLSSPPFLPYVAVSRAWQLAFEKPIWAKVHVESTELDDFERSFRAPHRRRYLRVLRLDIVLPDYDEYARCRFERPSEQRANNQAFTAAVRKLFAILAAWDQDPDNRPPSLVLHIDRVFSLSDMDLGRREKRPRAWKAGGAPEDLREFRYAYSTVRLLEPDSLPPVSFVTKFRFGTCSYVRRVDAGSAVEMARKFPGLQQLSLDAPDNQERYPGIQRDNRHSLAEALQRCRLPELREASIRISNDWWRWAPDRSLRGPDLVGLDQPRDPLGVSLHDFSRNLTSLVIEGCLDTSFLWPYADDESAAPCWPALRRLWLCLQPATPSGSWYSAGADPEDALSDKQQQEPLPGANSPEDVTKVDASPAVHTACPEHPPVFPEVTDLKTSDKTSRQECWNARGRLRASGGQIRATAETDLASLVAAFAKAARRMPLLEDADLSVTMKHSRMQDVWSISYAAPVPSNGKAAAATQGEPEAHPNVPFELLNDPDKAHLRKLVISTGPWRPDARALGLLRDIGGERHYDDPVVWFREKPRRFMDEKRVALALRQTAAALFYS